MRCVIYARYSSDLQSDSSIDDQIRDCRAYADRQGWQVVDVLADAAISGATLVLRPGVQAAIAAAAEGRCDVILVEALDRLSRNLGDTAKLQELLAFHQVRLVTLSKGEVTPMHVAFEGLMNSQALAEMALKIRRGQRGRALAGFSAGGISYGYEVVTELTAAGDVVRGKRRIRADQADVIRRIFREYAAGRSAVAIVAALNAEHVPAPRGGAWNTSTIIGHAQRRNGMFHNELYRGRLIYNRIRMLKDPRTGKRISRPNPPSEWVVVEAPELRIVSDEVWDKVQQIRTRGGGAVTPRNFQQRRRPEHLLTGLMFCGACGGSFTSKGHNRLCCSNHMNKRTCTNGRSVRRDILEGRALAEIRKFLEHPRIVEIALAEYRAEMERLNAQNSDRRAAAARELREIEGKIRRMVAAIEEGTIGAGAIAKRIAELEARQAQLQRDMASIDADAVALHPEAAKEFGRRISRLQETLQGADPVARTAAMREIRATIVRLEITPAAEPGRVNVALGIRGRPMERIETDGPKGLTRTPRLPEHSANKRGVLGGSGGGI